MNNNIRYDLQLYPRIPNKNVVHDERYNPETYVSIQHKVNTDPLFEEKYFEKLIKDGWVALKDINNIFFLPAGKTFKYRLNGNSLSRAPEGTFRSGGWIIGKNEDDPENNNQYILYKAYNGIVFPLQLNDILEIYIKNPKKEKPIFKKPTNITNYPVYLFSSETNKDEIVHYAKDEAHRTRFMNTLKYQRARATQDWSWSIVFINNIN